MFHLQNTEEDLAQKKKLIEQITDDFPAFIDKEGIEDEIERVMKDFETLEKRLPVYEDDLEKLVDHSKIFGDSLDDLSEWLPEVTKSAVLEEPVGRDRATVKEQIEDLRVSTIVSLSQFAWNWLKSIASLKTQNVLCIFCHSS